MPYRLVLNVTEQKDSLMFGKILSGIFGGFIVAVLGSMLVGIAVTSNPESAGEAGAIAFLVFWVIALILALTAQRAGKAWSRLFILSALIAFAMPLSAFLFTGAQVVDAAEQSGAAAAGAAIGGGMITAITGFIGFFVGVIFLIVGLLVGRDKQVIIIQEK